jgi:hypothetical protein
MVEVANASKPNMDAAQKTIAAMKQTGKVPKDTLCLLASKENPIKIHELSEEVMNKNGWIKLKEISLWKKCENTLKETIMLTLQPKQYVGTQCGKQKGHSGNCEFEISKGFSLSCPATSCDVQVTE